MPTYRVYKITRDADGRPQRTILKEGLTKEEAEAFWKAFVKKYSADESTIRRPTSEEFRLYWAMIPYDITEPLFVVESKSATRLKLVMSSALSRGCASGARASGGRARDYSGG